MIEWLEGWQGNPFKKPDRSEALRKKPKPDVVGLIGDFRWLTKEETEQHYISYRLGQLEKDGFKFIYPDPWTEWPPEYLDSVIAYDYAVNVLRARQKWDADNDYTNPGDWTKLQKQTMELTGMVSDFQRQQNKLLGKSMMDFFRPEARRRDLEKELQSRNEEEEEEKQIARQKAWNEHQFGKIPEANKNPI